MENVNISDMTLSQLADKYAEDNAIAKALGKRKKILRNLIIKKYEAGEKTEGLRVSIAEIENLDYEKSKDKWLEGGNEIPTVEIPSHIEEDTGKFLSLLDQNPEFKVFGKPTLRLTSS